MPNWVLVVLVIVAVLGAGLLRERWRLRGLRASTERGLLVEGTAVAREAWLTESRCLALEAWTGGGSFAVDGEYAAWRTQGLLSPARTQELVDQLPAVRRLLE